MILRKVRVNRHFTWLHGFAALYWPPRSLVIMVQLQDLAGQGIQTLLNQQGAQLIPMDSNGSQVIWQLFPTDSATNSSVRHPKRTAENWRMTHRERVGSPHLDYCVNELANGCHK